MKRILVPTDFSKESKNALRVAAQLAKKYDGEIFLLHMLELPLQQIESLSIEGTDLPEAMFFVKLAQQRFEELLNEDYLKGVSVRDKVEVFQNFGDIIKICKQHDIDMIVMGSHGASGLKEMFIGSNTEKVVRSSDIPVLVIKNHHEEFDVNSFVFASDFKNDNKETYKQATEFASLFNAKLHLVMVNTANRFITTAKAENRIHKFIEGNDFKNYDITIYNDITVEQGILNFSQNINADLIGISTHGRQGIAHFLNGSISEDLVNHAKRPVITFKI